MRLTEQSLNENVSLLNHGSLTLRMRVFFGNKVDGWIVQDFWKRLVRSFWIKEESGMMLRREVLRFGVRELRG